MACTWGLCGSGVIVDGHDLRPQNPFMEYNSLIILERATLSTHSEWVEFNWIPRVGSNDSGLLEDWEDCIDWLSVLVREDSKYALSRFPFLMIHRGAGKSFLRQCTSEQTSSDNFTGKGLPLLVHRRLTSSSPTCTRPFSRNSSKKTLKQGVRRLR